MGAAVDAKGLKRICLNGGVRFFDMNKRPIVCPSCDTEFTGEIKVKSRRSRGAAAAEEAAQELLSLHDRYQELEEAVSSGIRRIVALTGDKARENAESNISQLNQASELVGVSPAQLVQATDNLLKHAKALNAFDHYAGGPA